MCGIVGYIGSVGGDGHHPRRPEAPRIPRLRLRGPRRRLRRRAPDPARAPATSATSSRSSASGRSRGARHRAHPLGHPRAARPRPTRIPTSIARADRHRAQRHYRELPADQDPARRATSSSPRPTRRSSRTWSSATWPKRTGCPRRRAAVEKLRGAYAVGVATALRTCWSPPSGAGGVVIGFGDGEFVAPTSRRCCAHAGGRRPGRRRDGRGHRRGRRSVARRRLVERRRPHRLGRRGREERLPALHAQGNRRAAARAPDTMRGRICRHAARGPARAEPHAGPARLGLCSSSRAARRGTRRWSAADLERLAGLPVEVDIASEFRYRDPLVGPTPSWWRSPSRARPPTPSPR